MSTPKGKRCRVIQTAGGASLHVYSDAREVVLQLRRSIPTVDDLVTPSFKVAVGLTAAEVLAVAGELLQAAGILIRATADRCEDGTPETGAAVTTSHERLG